jgi:hypothetical protein
MAYGVKAGNYKNGWETPIGRNARHECDKAFGTKKPNSQMASRSRLLEVLDATSLLP